MEGDGIPTAVGSGPLPPPPLEPETTSVESPDDDDVDVDVDVDQGFQEEEDVAVTAVPPTADTTAAAVPPPSSSAAAETIVLTDDLKEKIIRQVEYYFSDENLPTDKFLMKHVKKDKQGFVPVAVITSFRKMKRLVANKSLVVAALRESSQLVLSSDGKRVRRLHPLPITEVKDAKSCTVFVENLPDDCSTENLRRIFGHVGNIKSISIRDPRATEDSAKSSKAEVAISGKIHALVEYETVKEAEKAVATLNDEQNWRNGMRVELLLKRMGKYCVTKKGRKGASDKNDNSSASHMTGNEHHVKSLDHHNETPEQTEGNHPLTDKVGRNHRNNRGRGQFKGHKQHNTNGHGHGSIPNGFRSEGLSKPPPGPRMPDGTRGFTMGRGRPPNNNSNQE